MTLLLAKVFLAPLCAVAVSLAGRRWGIGGVAQLEVLLRNFLVGFYGFASFCFVLAIALPDLATAASFGLATAAALVVQVALFLLANRAAASDFDPTPVGPESDAPSCGAADSVPNRLRSVELLK
jgi:hypothetical protein